MIILRLSCKLLLLQFCFILSFFSLNFTFFWLFSSFLFFDGSPINNLYINNHGGRSPPSNVYSSYKFYNNETGFGRFGSEFRSEPVIGTGSIGSARSDSLWLTEPKPNRQSRPHPYQQPLYQKILLWMPVFILVIRQLY